jgi:bacterioferritin-associated ferredoxin
MKLEASTKLHRENLTLSTNLSRQLWRMKDLLRAVGVAQTCAGCGREIWWVFHVHVKRSVPYDLDGELHYLTCPNRERWCTERREVEARRA